MRYFLTLAYNGTNYHGWQLQENASTVQEEVEKALSTLLGTYTSSVGAGRTDTGVHAFRYVAHFDTDRLLSDPARFVYRLNALLPRDIAARSVCPVRSDAHARFDAYERAYTYFISREKNPFGRDTSWQYYGELDVEAMNRAAGWLLRYEDFTSFAKLNSSNKTNICHITYAGWIEKDRQLIFTIRANRFLRNMVRAITGTIVEVGKGRITPEDFKRIIEAKDLSLSGTSAPAQGLFLSGIKYPPSVFTATKHI